MSACIGLKPKPDNTKTYALGLFEPTQVHSNTPTISGYISRPQLPVYMEGSGLKIISEDGEITSLSEARWAEPMDVGIARTMNHYIEMLSSNLTSDFYPWTCKNGTAFKLQLDFDQLVATIDGRILISANWSYKYGDDQLKRGFFNDSTIEWSPGDAQSMISGVNQVLRLLAADIVKALEKEIPTQSGIDKPEYE